MAANMAEILGSTGHSLSSIRARDTILRPLDSFRGQGLQRHHQFKIGLQENMGVQYGGNLAFEWLSLEFYHRESQNIGVHCMIFTVKKYNLI